jgi:hypothetical protein
VGAFLVKLKHIGGGHYPRPTIHAITSGSQRILRTTGLNSSPHKYTLYPLTHLAAYYLKRRQYPDQHEDDQQPEDDESEDVRNFALRLAAAMHDSLVVEPFEAAAGKETACAAGCTHRRRRGSETRC